MLEPMFFLTKTGHEIPFSEAPLWMLQEIKDIEPEPWIDNDFQLRYAQILLNERLGLT